MKLEDEQLEKLERYLSASMSASENEKFQEELAASEEMQEFLEIYNEIDAAENEDQWIATASNSEKIKGIAQKYRSKETVEFSQKLKSFRATSEPTNNQTKKRRFNLAIVAAVAACLTAIVYFTIPKTTDLAEVYTEYSTWEELPSFVVKGALDDQRVEVERLFTSERYKDAIVLAERIIETTNVEEVTLWLYMGISQLEIDQVDEAIASFKMITTMDSLDRTKGYWYIAMAYIKQGNQEMAIDALKKVISSERNYRYREAKEILKGLK